MDIEDPQVESLICRLVAETGETPREALVRALEDRLAQCRQVPGPPRDRTRVFEAIMEISRRCSALPDLDRRGADEILAYNAVGVPD
jgi:antitoxin VapB